LSFLTLHAGLEIYYTAGDGQLRCPVTGRATGPLWTERERKRTHARIVRDQCQHVPSSRRTGDQPNHSGPIEAGQSIGADVCAVGVTDWLPVQQHGHCAVA
jgi:hypothetical protein